MPIRMEKDPEQNRDRQQPRDPGRQNTGGGGGLLKKALPFIIMFLFKRPKLIIPALLIGAIWFFFFGGGADMFSGGGEADQGFDDSMFSLGANFDQEKYDKTEVFAPLAAGSWNGMPSKVSLESYAPTRGQQGRQGSCVGWASAYSARTILHSRATGKDPNSVAFSPAYLYNQIALEGCQGAYMLDAMKAMYENGGLPYNEFKYDESSCRKAPQFDESSEPLGNSKELIEPEQRSFPNISILEDQSIDRNKSADISKDLLDLNNDEKF